MAPSVSCSERPHKVIPFHGQNLTAIEQAPGMEGAIEWLKFERIHKYWPLFTHLSYSMLLELHADTWDWNMKAIGAEGITKGAKGKILRLTESLRARSNTLLKLLGSGNFTIQAMCTVLEPMLLTPMTPKYPEPNGMFLVPIVLRVLEKGISCLTNVKKDIMSMRTVIRLFIGHPSMPENEKSQIVQRFELKVLQLEEQRASLKNIWTPGINTVLFDFGTLNRDEFEEYTIFFDKHSLIKW